VQDLGAGPRELANCRACQSTLQWPLSEVTEVGKRSNEDWLPPLIPERSLEVDQFEAALFWVSDAREAMF
jgi:hypothetical protein